MFWLMLRNKQFFIVEYTAHYKSAAHHYIRTYTDKSHWFHYCYVWTDFIVVKWTDIYNLQFWILFATVYLNYQTIIIYYLAIL